MRPFLFGRVKIGDVPHPEGMLASDEVDIWWLAPLGPSMQRHFATCNNLAVLLGFTRSPRRRRIA
jgi:hypothetical protein